MKKVNIGSKCNTLITVQAAVKFIFRHSDVWACCQTIVSDIMDTCITPSTRQKGIKEDKTVLKLYKTLVKSPFKSVTFDHTFTESELQNMNIPTLQVDHKEDHC